MNFFLCKKKLNRTIKTMINLYRQKQSISCIFIISISSRRFRKKRNVFILHNYCRGPKTLVISSYYMSLVQPYGLLREKNFCRKTPFSEKKPSWSRNDSWKFLHCLTCTCVCTSAAYSSLSGEKEVILIQWILSVLYLNVRLIYIKSRETIFRLKL